MGGLYYDIYKETMNIKHNIVFCLHHAIYICHTIRHDGFSHLPPHFMTTFGTDIDTFIATYIPESKKELATAELNLIVLKSMRAQLIEMRPASLSA